MPEPNDIKKLQALIPLSQIAMVNTINPAGEISSRPMRLQQCDSDGMLWFITDDQTYKVKELNKNEHVTVTFSDEEMYTFVTIQGHGELKKDPKKIKELWSNRMKQWFPKGPDDPHLMLIRMKIDTVEYWDSTGGKTLQTSSEQAVEYDEFQV